MRINHFFFAPLTKVALPLIKRLLTPLVKSFLAPLRLATAVPLRDATIQKTFMNLE